MDRKGKKETEREREGGSLLEDVVLLIDGNGVRDGDSAGGRNGLELLKRGIKVDPLGLVQREVAVLHSLSYFLGAPEIENQDEAA
jgi:hypothetical protein